MKKIILSMTFSSLLFLGATTLTASAEEVATDSTVELTANTGDTENNTGETISVNPTQVVGSSNVLGEAINSNNHAGVDGLSFSVPKPAELAGYGLGEVTISGFTYDPSSPEVIGTVTLAHNLDNGKFDAEMVYTVYDKGATLFFSAGYGNMNVGSVNYPGTPLTPFLEGNTAFNTPKGTVNSNVKVVFTNIEQPGGNTGNTEQPGGNAGNTEQPGGNAGNTEQPGGNAGNTEQPTNNNEKEFVENIKNNGSTEEVYVENDTLPQTSQSNTVFYGALMMILTISTAVYAKVKFF